jgi:hypothetical protein
MVGASCESDLADCGDYVAWLEFSDYAADKRVCLWRPRCRCALSLRESTFAADRRVVLQVLIVKGVVTIGRYPKRIRSHKLFDNKHLPCMKPRDLRDFTAAGGCFFGRPQLLS